MPNTPDDPDLDRDLVTDACRYRGNPGFEKVDRVNGSARLRRGGIVPADRSAQGLARSRSRSAPDKYLRIAFRFACSGCIWLFPHGVRALDVSWPSAPSALPRTIPYSSTAVAWCRLCSRPNAPSFSSATPGRDGLARVEPRPSRREPCSVAGLRQCNLPPFGRFPSHRGGGDHGQGRLRQGCTATAQGDAQSEVGRPTFRARFRERFADRRSSGWRCRSKCATPLSRLARRCLRSAGKLPG